MRTARFLTTLLVAGLATANAFAAKSPSTRPAAPAPLYTLDKAARPVASQWLVPDEAEEFAIRVNPETVAANPSAFTIDLPGLPALEAVRKRFVVYKADWKSWIGTLRNTGTEGPGTGYIHLGYHGKQLTGLIEFEGNHYRIVGVDGGHLLVRTSEDLSPPSCALDTQADSGNTAPFFGQDPSTSDSSLPAKTASGITTKVATNRIDLLVVYPKAYFTLGPAAETALGNFVRDSISLANDAFTNSSIDAYYNLVGIVPITNTDQPTTGISNGLLWLNGLTSTSEVANLRNAFGADVVNLFVPFSWNNPDNCGVANLPESDGTLYGPNGKTASPFGDKAFSAMRDACGQGDYTLGHEIGHNYGMHHEIDPAPGDTFPKYPNGRGFTLPVQNKATVMACVCSGCACNRTCPLTSGAICNRIPYFSDPAISYLGESTGDSTHNNAAVGRSEIANYAGFRMQSTNTPPTANFTVSCSGRTCTFTSTSTDNAAIPSTGYWWDFGYGGATGANSSVTYTYPAYSSYYVHLVVTDAGGQTSVKEVTVTPSPSYEGYLENANCRALSGWAWDHTPNSPINVDIYRDGGFVTSVSANAFRQDLLNAGKGNGAHGFGYTPDSSWKNGQWRSASVRFGGTATNLTWSPQSIICGVSCFPTTTPTENNDTAGVVYTVATQFSSSYSGYITHLRFYRASGETGTNVGYLWSDSGSLLASVTFPASPSSGWVEAQLSSPVAISAGTRYRVGVNTNTRQSKTSCGIGSGITNQVLTAYQGFWIAGNGTFPTTSSCSNFFADVKFDL